MSERPPVWTKEVSDALVGRTVVIGRTLMRRAGGIDHFEELHGLIESASAEGIAVRLHGVRDGELFDLPPDPKAILPAARGTYRLKSTGEEVVDPDYISTWVITLPE
jgi:hypothetical protein